MQCFDCKKQQNIETKQLNTETKRQNANFFLPVYVKCRDTLKNFEAVLELGFSAFIDQPREIKG